MNRRVLLIGALITIPVLVVLALGLERDPHQIDSPLIGKAAPGFDLPVLGSSDRLALADLRGRPSVLNFWASWCVPCLAEHPVLTSVARQIGDEVNFVGIIHEDSDESATEFLTRFGVAYPNVQDPGGRAAIAYGIYGVPETYFLDAEGRITAKHVGPLDTDSLREYLVAAGWTGNR